MAVISMNFPARKEDGYEDHSLRVDGALSLPVSISLIPFLTPSHKTPLLLPLVIYISLLCKFMITFASCFMIRKSPHVRGHSQTKMQGSTWLSLHPGPLILRMPTL
jgi:uncharacterized membrane protein